ncbi:lysophospholipase [Roseibium aquae]|uniref:Lysophospholipase n=1 Tax=Roseibium aquae TaxID=1323746 RepID=A0A916T5A9_9HYPH|nr:alpha/beta hydrolase [Roseibium aquae]GGB32314.1 lysophospholipase [Roseibium aquae]
MTLSDIPENPVPRGAKAGFVVTRDGVQLRYAHWPALGSRRLGTVTILQGRAEFIEKYFEVVTDLRDRGFAVVAFDWRGQGGSDRLLGNRFKGHVRSFAQYREDLRTVLKQVSLAEYPGPHFALAHSMGGAILLSDSARLRTMLDRAVLCAPMIALPRGQWLPDIFGGLRRLVNSATFGFYKVPPDIRRFGATSRFLNKVVFPFVRVLGFLGLGRFFLPGGTGEILLDFETNRQTSDRSRFERFNAVLKATPERGIGAPTIGWLSAAIKTMRKFSLRETGPGIKLPCLVIAAGRDRIVSTPAIEEFVSRVKVAGYIEIAGGEHELLMEADVYRDQFFAAFDAFIPGLDGRKDPEA